MGLFGKKSNQDICNEYISKARSARKKWEYFGDISASVVKAYDKAYRELGENEITPAMMLMDALLADCTAARSLKVSFGYRKDEKSISERYDRFRNCLAAKRAFNEEDLDAAGLACQVYLEHKKQLTTFLNLKKIYSMKLPDLLPALLVDEVAEKYIDNDKMGAFLLYDAYVDVSSEIQGKCNFQAAKLLLEMDSGNQSYLDYAGKRLEAAAGLDYPGAKELLQKISETDNKKEEKGQAADSDTEKIVLSGMQMLMNDADQRFKETGNPDLYLAICSDGAVRYGSEKAQEIAILAARKFNTIVDAMINKGMIGKQNMNLLFEQRKINVKLAEEGFTAFMSKAADALRDGYGDIPQDLLKARTYYINAAKAGDRHALLYYGIFCKEGIGGPLNPDGAASAFAKVVQGGDDAISARAYYNLSEMFEKGTGIGQDAESARSSMELAEQLGWDELSQKILAARAKLGQYYKELSGNEEIVGEILERFKDQETGSIVLPEIY